MADRTPLTPQSLYNFAKRYGLENDRLRICDGMAVSYFPTRSSLARTKSRVIIDVSDEDPVEFDNLSADDQTIIYQQKTHDPYAPVEVGDWIDAHAIKL